MRLPTVVIRNDVLESWLTISDYSKSRLANELGISKGRISQLLTSHEEPSAHLIAKLMTLTYLPFDRLFKIVHDSTPSVFVRSQKTTASLTKLTRKTTSGTTPFLGTHGRRRLGRARAGTALLKGAE